MAGFCVSHQQQQPLLIAGLGRRTDTKLGGKICIRLYCALLLLKNGRGQFREIEKQVEMEPSRPVVKSGEWRHEIGTLKERGRVGRTQAVEA